METRQVNQVKIWKLIMNDMRMPQIELQELQAISVDRQKLIDLLESEKCKPYSDGIWGKSFKKGGRLEWKNPFYHNGNYIGKSHGHGVISEWVNEDIFINHIKFHEKYII